MNKVVQELAIKTFSAVYSVVVTQIVYEGLKAVCYKVQESKNRLFSFLREIFMLYYEKESN